MAPDEIKPSQLPYRRTMITSSEIPRSTLKPSLSPSPLTIEDKSLSSLGLSESEKDDEPKKLAMIPSRPSSKSKTRSTIIKEAPGRTPNLNCGDFCPSPPISENVSHEQRLSTLLEKFRSLDGVS